MRESRKYGCVQFLDATFSVVKTLGSVSRRAMNSAKYVINVYVFAQVVLALKSDSTINCRNVKTYNPFYGQVNFKICPPKHIQLLSEPTHEEVNGAFYKPDPKICGEMLHRFRATPRPFCYSNSRGDMSLKSAIKKLIRVIFWHG